MLLHYLGKEETGKFKIASFRLNAVCCFANEHTKRIQVITRSQLNHPSFVKQSTVCMHQTGPRKGAQHAIVCYHKLLVNQVCYDVGRCVKMGVVLR